MNTTGPRRRRVLMLLPAGAAGALAALPAARAADEPPLSEGDPRAVSLGYVADTTRADRARFPRWTAAQSCSGCQLWLGRAGEAAGRCPLFAGRQVAARGWCNAWARKA